MTFTESAVLGDGVEPWHAREAYQRNRTTQFSSRAKDLLYNVPREPTPIHQGKKSVAHAGSASGVAPYATNKPEPQGSAAPAPHQVYHAKKSQKEGADKVSHLEFDPDVYRVAIKDNASNRTAQRARAWGSGSILTFKDQAQLVQEKKAAELQRLQEEEEAREARDAQ